MAGKHLVYLVLSGLAHRHFLLRGQQETGLCRRYFNQLQEEQLNLGSQLLWRKFCKALEHLFLWSVWMPNAHQVNREPVIHAKIVY